MLLFIDAKIRIPDVLQSAGKFLFGRNMRRFTFKTPQGRQRQHGGIKSTSASFRNIQRQCQQIHRIAVYCQPFGPSRVIQAVNVAARNTPGNLIFQSCHSLCCFCGRLLTLRPVYRLLDICCHCIRIIRIHLRPISKPRPKDNENNNQNRQGRKHRCCDFFVFGHCCLLIVESCILLDFFDSPYYSIKKCTCPFFHSMKWFLFDSGKRFSL